MVDDGKLRVSGQTPRDPVLPKWETSRSPSKDPLHSSIYVIIWIFLSSSVIIFNKKILDDMEFHYPAILTTWHLVFASLITQIMARFTKLLDGRKAARMTTAVYTRTIVPIGLLFSLSLICGNLTYLYLSVAFIQMLKATTPVAVLLSSWSMSLSHPSFGQLFNVTVIVVGIVLATFGEIEFELIGFLVQCGGIGFEAMRLVLVQKLLNGPEHKMNPLVSLYYFAPLCACMNGIVALLFEIPKLEVDEVYAVGIPVLVVNAVLAFLLNVSVVFLIGKTSSLVLTLCGVLKDVLLVAASTIIWGTPVSPLQNFGYSIALSGLIYYKLGGEQLKIHFTAGRHRWMAYGRDYPLARTLFVFLVAMAIVVMFVHGMTPGFGDSYDDAEYLSTAAAAKKLGSWV